MSPILSALRTAGSISLADLLLRILRPAEDLRRELTQLFHLGVIEAVRVGEKHVREVPLDELLAVLNDVRDLEKEWGGGTPAYESALFAYLREKQAPREIRLRLTRQGHHTLATS